MDELMALRPVYCVYSALADFFSIPVGEREGLLICNATALERKRERGGGRGGEHQKERDAKYTPSIFGSTCASRSRRVGVTTGS